MEELGPGTLIVRGGSNRDPDDLVERIEDAIADGYGPVLSVNCGHPEDDETVTDSLRRICAVAGLPHGTVQVARYERIKALGITLTSDTSEEQAENHYHAWFGVPVAKSQVQDFIVCFDGPIPNPTGGKQRSLR